MISSAVVQETVSEILSNMKAKYKGRSNPKEHMERLEMAHIRLEAALHTSDGWNITSAPLLRWRGKLKRAMQECDETLHRCKKRTKEVEAMEDGVRSSSSFPKRIAHNAKSFVSSIFNGASSSDELSGSTVRRFEWFAEGATEFLRFVELGGTARQYMFFDPLVRHLLAGNTTEYKLVLQNQHHLFCLRPVSTPEGMEGRLLYALKDGDAPENSFLLALTLQISESTNIVRVAVRCLELFTPHFKSTSEIVKTKLTQLPVHDFSWVPYVDSGDKHHWNNAHGIFSKWFRPNPHCCKQKHGHNQYQQQPYDTGSNTKSSWHRDVYLEPVIKVYLLGHVPVSSGSNQEKGSPYMKLRLLFSPHTSTEGMLSSSVGGSAMEMVPGQEHHGLYPNISFEQLEDIMLPKATDCFRQNAGAAEYQMLWRSKHGGAYIQVEECTPKRIFGRNSRKGHRQERQNEKVEGWTNAVIDFLSSWVAHAPTDLQSSIVDWINVETELAPTRL
ncbi:unnamed protein product [Urochloa decumbens]|uniref:Uncharacterized protein n=1 Tax=Urochloa decumbens TaxID=240449 RepID=A0ABC9FLJ1_9POAL